MSLSRFRKKKFDIEQVNELVEHNIEAAADIDVDETKCMNEIVLKWMKNYDSFTSGQPLTLYYALMSTLAHICIQSEVLQWNTIARHLNLYAIIIGSSGIFELTKKKMMISFQIH